MSTKTGLELTWIKCNRSGPGKNPCHDPGAA